MDSLEAFVEQLDEKDVDRQGLALEALVKRGKTAVPVLLKALHQGSAQVRALAAEGLGQIADPQTADALFAAVADHDERVRSLAAVALAKLKDPRALSALLQTLDDNPDLLHVHMSPSAYALTRWGAAALPAIAPRLKAEGLFTRMQAFTILWGIVSEMPGQNWDQLWKDLGKYDPNGLPEERNQAADLWIEWIDNFHGNSSA